MQVVAFEFLVYETFDANMKIKVSINFEANKGMNLDKIQVRKR